MKHLFQNLFIVFVLSCFAGCSTPALAKKQLAIKPPSSLQLKGLYRGTFPKKKSVGFHAASLVVNGIKRDLKVYFPIKVAKKPALILVAHGTGGNAEDGVWNTAANEAADAHGAVIVSLQARKMHKGDWDNHKSGQVYFETYPNLDPTKNNDLQFVAAAIEEAKRAYHIDPKRIFIAGFSNGAFFAQFAALVFSDRIAGFASSAGGQVPCKGTGSCGFRGKSLTCETLAKESGFCHCKGFGKPFPIEKAAGKPAAYIAHSIHDDTVSSYYSCKLEEALKKNGNPVKLDLRKEGDHGSPPHFMVSAWKFLIKHPLK